MPEVFSNMNISNKLVKPNVNNQQAGIPVQNVLPATNVSQDQVQLTQPKEKMSVFKRISKGIANIKKGFVSFGEHTKGVFSGLGKGAVVGSLIYTGGAIINQLKKGPKKIHNVVLASLGAAATVGLNVWKGHLNANEKMSDIDHRWTGHQ